jgi:23S rRNA pseudouridine1911/1915/1917 synthase
MTIIADKETRLDKYISDKLSQSRNQIQTLINNSHIIVNNKIVKKSSHKLNIDDVISIKLPKAQKPPKIDFDESKYNIKIIYEDNDILVIDKPPFLIIHDAPSVHEATLVDWLKYKGISLSTLAGEVRHGIVHRLDKQTSGAMVVAKTNQAHINLSKQLKDKSMGRYYLCIVDNPLKEQKIIDQPIARNPKNRLKMSVTAGGRESKTLYQPIQTSQDEKQQLLLCKLYSGRTHQIRVHLNYINRHILGDETYGYKPTKIDIPRVYLHAYLLYLIHPLSGKKIFFNADLPQDIRAYLEENFDYESIKDEINTDNIINNFS